MRYGWHLDYDSYGEAMGFPLLVSVLLLQTTARWPLGSLILLRRVSDCAVNVGVLTFLLNLSVHRRQCNIKRVCGAGGLLNFASGRCAVQTKSRRVCILGGPRVRNKDHR